MIVLRKELLYSTQGQEIFKTYDPLKDRYGLCRLTSLGAEIVKARYKYIFPFYENDRGVIVTEKENYRWIDVNWRIFSMSEDEEDKYRNYIHKNSNCLCSGLNLSHPCEICGGSEQIENSFAYKQNRRFFLNW